MAGYVYNPAESITQSFQQAQAGIGNLFTQIIAQQQRDYNLAESTLNNAEALKKNLGLWGTKEVTDGANEILGQVTAAITKNGRVDFSKLGEARQQISNLSDLKTGYEVFGQNFDRLTQMAAANKENITSYESLYKNLMGIASNKKLIMNPNDMTKAMNDIVEDHINTTKMGITAIKNVLPILPVGGQYTDPKSKSEITYAGEIFEGVSVGADGRLIKPTDPTFYQGLAERIKAFDPAVIDSHRKKLSRQGITEISDADVAKSWFDSVPAGALKPVSIKAERTVKKEEAETEIVIFNNDKKQQIYNDQRRAQQLANQLRGLEIQKIKLEINAKKALDAAPANTFRTTFPISSLSTGKKVGDLPARGTDLGTGIQMVVPTASGSKNINVKQIFYDKNGDARVAYLEKLPSKAATENQYKIMNMASGGEIFGIPTAAPVAEKLSFARVPKESVHRFVASLESNLRKEYSDDKDFAKVWKDVQATFTPVRVSGEMDGDTIYLDKAYRGSEDKILKDSGMKKVVFIEN